MQWSKYFNSVILASALIVSCGEDAHKPTDTLSSGTIDISVDETYKPIVEEQKKVFDSSYPEAHLQTVYKPEAECIKDFMEGKAKMIMATRELSKDEKEVLAQKKIVATSLALAKDAVAIVLNKDAKDTVFSISQLKGILTGQYSKKYTVVFDNQGSSTLRYILDSLIPGEKLGPNVFAAKTNDSLIDYISKNTEAIGFTSVSYVSDFADPEGLAFINNVKIGEVIHEKTQQANKPYQAYIANGAYPLTRNLYYIHRETYPGLATGFANFLTNERGQLVFKQARLFPLRTNIIIREATVNP